MTLDEIEKLARNVSERASKTEDDIRTCHRLEAFQTMTAIAGENAAHAIDLARALLLVMPVVRAAERMRNAGQVCEAMTADDPDRGQKQAAYSDGCFAVERAIDTMRAALAKETK